MPRSRGSGGGSRAPPSRPTIAPQRSVAPANPTQNRPVSTAAQPGAQAPPHAPTSQGPGLFGQMASTAAGVAVGSSIGHAIGGFFGGGSAAPAEQQEQQPMQQQQYNSSSSQYGGASCEEQAKNFTQCLDQNGGNMQICGWYLEQLKSCQAAAARY